MQHELLLFNLADPFTANASPSDFPGTWDDHFGSINIRQLLQLSETCHALVDHECPVELSERCVANKLVTSKPEIQGKLGLQQECALF
jgi:hypothetical protein